MERCIITIAGESGVGKTNISECLSIFFGKDDCVLLSGDDLHLWERGDDNWKNITHLNPLANNLALGDLHLESLSNGLAISRSKYNHVTGKFDAPELISPKKYIISEGLHAFFTDKSKNLSSIKIFVQNDEQLRVHWKVIRDMEDRQHSFEEVISSIDSRKKDSKTIRDAQMNEADLVLGFYPKSQIMNIGNKLEKVEVELRVDNRKAPQELVEFIINFYQAFSEVVRLSSEFNSSDLVQHTGGNISVKCGDLLLIKSSGTKLNDFHKKPGKMILSQFDDSLIYEEAIEKASVGKYKPSMESGFHAILDKYVVHLHPIYLNAILSLTNSSEKVVEIFGKDVQYIVFEIPGSALYQRIKKSIKHKVIFLENHGLVVSSNSMEEVISLTKSITLKAKQFLKDQLGSSFCDFEINDLEKASPIFPDAAVFPNQLEVQSANSYINKYGKMIGDVRFLNQDQVEEISNSSSEKFRQAL